MLQSYKIRKIVFGEVSVNLPKSVNMMLDLDNCSQVRKAVKDLLQDYIYYKNVDKMLVKLGA